MTSKSWSVPIDSDGVASFPEDLVKTMDWDEGTILVWDIRDDGSISLRAATDDDLDKARTE